MCHIDGGKSPEKARNDYMLMLGGRRCDIDIIADILQLGEAGKTEIIGAARITHSQLNRYLTRLLTLNLVEKYNPAYYRETYRVTEKGRKLLYTINGIRQMLQPRRSFTE